MADVSMPRLSDTMEEGTIARWLKQPGDEVKRGDVLAQVETDKATMDLEAFDAGTLVEILAPEGTTVPIGQPVARLGAAGDAPAPGGSAPSQPVAQAPTGVQQQPAPPVVDQGAPVTSATPSTPPTSETAEAPSPAGDVPAPRPPTTNGRASPGKVRASPLARRIAEEHGLDLGALHGSGPEGRVIRADVEAALAKPTVSSAATGAAAAAESPPAAPVETAAEDERVPLSQMRRTIARRMAESTSTVPHFFLTVTIDATEMVQLRAQINAQLDAAGDGAKVSLNDLVVKAVALALRKVPDMNVAYDGDALIRRAHTHIGVAVATDKGLIVPVLPDVDRKSLSQISRETRDLSVRARDGKLQPADYTGGTFTVSNLGMFGVEQFQAVINPPEAGILAVGAVMKEPAEHQGEIALRERMRVTLSVDHRAADGATGARYLQELKKLLEQPLLLLV